MIALIARSLSGSSSIRGSFKKISRAGGKVTPSGKAKGKRQKSKVWGSFLLPFALCPLPLSEASGNVELESDGGEELLATPLVGGDGCV